MNGLGGCPNVGGICIGCTMPGFPDKFMPFMDEPPGNKLSTNVIRAWGATLRKLRGATAHVVDQEPKWRKPVPSSLPAPNAPGSSPLQLRKPSPL